MAGQTACSEYSLVTLAGDISADDIRLAFVVAATVVTSQVGRMFSFLILGLDLSHRVRPWELHIFWLLLGIGTGSRDYVCCPFSS
jgi:hypothetical protein